MTPPLEVVTAALPRHLGILRRTVRGLREFAPVKTIHVITAGKNFRRFRAALGGDVELLDEDTLIPDMTLAALRAFNGPSFPQAAGWYFQQYLKLAFAFRPSTDSHFLIWDADTIPLRPLRFFDDDGRMMFVKSAEYHEPYFANYRHLIGAEPNREFSFISQHMPVERASLREMLERIDARFPGDESWAWKIMRNLPRTGSDLFSEYEFYGHYLKSFHPEKAVFVERPWTRDGTRLKSFRPTDADLLDLARDYDFAAFEHYQTPLWRLLRAVKRYLRR